MPIAGDNFSVEAIIRTIAFFDLFDWPLTSLEIKAEIGGETPLLAVLEALDAIVAAGTASQAEGFYFLPARQDIIAERQRRYNHFVRKLKIARRFARLFCLWPTVRAVYLSNAMGAYNLRDGSDIDLFVVTAPGRLWISRLYCAGLAKLLNRRPTPRRKRDRLCLSFYVSSDFRDWDSLKLSGGDPYFDHWQKNLILLYNKEATAPGQSSPAAPVAFSSSWRENLARKFQMMIMPAALRAAINNSDGVRVSDAVLKFHIRDRRREYAEKYDAKIEEISGARR